MGIESDIINSLKAIPQISRNEGWEWKRSKWTKHIKNSLCDLAKQNNYMVAANKCAAADSAEWLYDMVWYEEENKLLTNIPLVLESELNSPNILVDDDFYKLLLAKADNRVWIFERKTKDDIKKSFEACKEAIHAFKQSKYGDKYILIGVDWSEREFISEVYLFQQHAANKAN